MREDPPPGQTGEPQSDEARREKALAWLGVLDTPREQDFDDIVRMAARLCGTPIALVSLLDTTRQWFKAELGLGLSETSLDVSFCRHAAADGAGTHLVVSDATRDPRFADNPLVTGPQSIRSYAGAVLRTSDGIALGTLCVLDRQPRELSADQLEDLSVLARQVVAQMELRRALREQRALDAHHRQILASAIDYAVLTTDLDGRVTSWNTGAERILGFAESEMRGRTLHTVFTPEDRAMGRPEAEMGEALATGAAPDERWHLRKDGARFRASGRLMVLRSETGDAVGFLKILRDSTAEWQAIQDREAGRALVVAGERRWRGLFERMAEGVVVAEAVRDAEGRLADVTLTELNPAFEVLTGLPVADAVGRRLRSILPDTPDRLVEAFAGVLATGEPDTFEIGMPSLGGRSFEGRIQKGEGDGVIVLFSDTTARKAGERRRNALVELGDRLRDARSPAEAAHAAGHVMAATLGTGRAGYGLIDPVREIITTERDWTAPGVPSIAGILRFREHGSYIEDLKRGETVVVADTREDARTVPTWTALERIAVRSFVNMPVFERGAFVGLVFVTDAQPRAWLPEEVIFIRNVADRTRAAVARLRAEERQRLLNRELGHRLKNTLAMVQAVTAQTLRNATSVADAQEALTSRMVALGKAHDILLSGERESARLGELVRSAVSILEDGEARFRLDGPDIEVGSRAALSLALMLHELGTNALKYGSLSGPDGIVSVRWHIEGDGTDAIVVLAWTEEGGPPVEPPRRKGFGSRLITRGLAGQIGGQVMLGFPREGVRCLVRCPLLAFQADEIHPVRPGDATERA